MKPKLLFKIAEVINGSGGTYRAIVPYDKHEYMVLDGSSLIRSSCHVLRIILSGKPKNHVSKSVWNIYENDMDKVIKKISRRDRAFAERMASCTPSANDVEWIVRRASFRFLNLRISCSSYYIYMGNGNGR